MVDFAKMLEQQREKLEAENEKRIQPFMKVERVKPVCNVSVSIAGPDYAIKFGYDGALLSKLKAAVSESDRTWHKGQKVWLVAPEAIDKAVEVIRSHTGKTLVLPEAKPVASSILEKTFQLDYLGATKDRGSRKTAYGSVNGDWASEFPEDVLKKYFEGTEEGKPADGLQTLYQVLCIPETSSGEDIKRAYKRLARVNHPDVNKEPDAHELFIKLNESYEILINPEKKARYDAGLYFERQSQDDRINREAFFQRRQERLYGYRAPLRCGLITAKGTVRLMRFVVSEIIKWDDVVNEAGQVMSSSWSKDADKFEIKWV